MSLATRMGCSGRSNGIPNAVMTPLHHFRTTQVRSIRSKPIQRIGLYRVPGVQVLARSDNEQKAYAQSSSSTETSPIASIASRVLISIPIAAAILGLMPRKVSAATATVDLSAINCNHEASVMDHRTGMPHKWLYSNDNHWSHSEYDAIYKFYTEGLPSPQTQSASSSKAASAETSSPSYSASVAKKEQNNIVVKSINAEGAAVVTEKRKKDAAKVQNRAPPGKVASIIEALNKKSEKVTEHETQQKTALETQTAVKQAKQVATPIIPAKQASLFKLQATSAPVASGDPSAFAKTHTSPSAAALSVSKSSESVLTSVNAFRMAVGQSIISQVNEMRSCAAPAAKKKAAMGNVEESVPSKNQAKGSVSISELKSQMSGIARRGASIVVEGTSNVADTVGVVAGQGAHAVIEGAGAAFSVASRGPSVAADGASNIASSAVSFAGRASTAVVDGVSIAATVAGRGASAFAGNARAAATNAATVAGRGASAVGGSANTAANAAVNAASQGASVVVDGAHAAASQTAQQAVVLLSKADTFKNSIGAAALRQASSFRNATNEAFQSTKTAITDAPAVHAAADKKKNVKPVKAAAISCPKSKPVVATAKTAQPAKKQARQQKVTGQQSEQKQSIEVLAKAEAFRQTLGHAVFSQMTAFRQAAVTVKNAFPTLPAFSNASSSSSSIKQTKAAAKAPAVQKQPKTTIKTTKNTVNTMKSSSSSSSSSSPFSLSKATMLAESLSKDVVVMKDAIVAAFNWQPTTLAQSATTTSSSNNTSRKGVSGKTSKGSVNGRGGGGGGASSLWGWVPSTLGHPVPITTSAGASASSPWGWNPRKYFSSSASASSSSANSAYAADASAPSFGWAPQNFGASSASASTSAASAAASSQWNWSPTTFFPSSSAASSSSSSASSPQWNWNPTAFPSTPRVALIAAGLIGCAYILGVAWKQVNNNNNNNKNATLLNSNEGSAEGAVDTEAATHGEEGTTTRGGNVVMGGIEDDNESENGTVMAGFSSNIYDKAVSLGPSSNLFDGPGLSGAGAATAAAGTVGRSREELIAESQRRINAAKEALAKAEQQKAEAASAAAAAAEEAVAKQEQKVSDAAADNTASSSSSSTSLPSSSSAQASHNASITDQSRKEKSIADSFDMVRSIIHSAALVQDWGTPLTTKYDPLQNTIGKITSSQSQWELSDWAGPSKYCPVTDIVQGISSTPPPSGIASKYDPFSSTIKNIATRSWTGPARDRIKTPLREEKYDMIAALFSAIMLQKDPPLRKDQNTDDILWDPVAAALDAAAGWQPPQPRSFRSSSTGTTIIIGEQDKYDLTASLMAGLYAITPPRMADGGARWDPVKHLLSGWAAEWEGTAVDIRKPVSPTYDPAAGMKGAVPSEVRSKYDWAQAVLQSEAPTSDISSNGGSGGGGKRAWLVRAGSSFKENVPRMLRWKGGERSGGTIGTGGTTGGTTGGGGGGSNSDAVVGSVSRAIGSDRDDN